MAQRSETIWALNSLITTARDGEQGFKSAEEAVTDAEFKSLFASIADQRSRFVSQLQELVTRLGGEPEDTGSVAASLHRGWMNVKSALTGGDEGAILSACETGEDSAKRAYEDALRTSSLPAEVRATVEEQYRQVKEAHDRIRDLRDRRRAA